MPGQNRSSTSSGIAWTCAWTSGREPLRPETIASRRQSEIGRSKRPAIARAGEHGGLVEDQRLALDPAASGQPDDVRANIGDGREGEGGAAAAGEGRADLARAVDQLGVGGEARERNRAGGYAARIDCPVDRRAVVGENDGPVRAAASNREHIGEIGIVGGEMRVDPLVARNRREIERPAERAVGEHQPSAESAGSDRRLPLACAPPASSVAIAITVGALCGSRIWPALVNGPSRDPPLAR